MIRINLIPPEYIDAQKKKEMQIIAGTAGGAFVLFLALFWMIKSRQAAVLEQNIITAQAELQKFEAIVSQIERIEADKRALSAKRDVIRNLNRSRLVYPVLFEDLLPIIPGDVWITNLTVNDTGGAMRLVLTSNAMSNFAVATWLTNLQQSTHFTGIELSPISYSAATDTNAQKLSFTVTCSYQHKGPFPLSEFN